MSPVEERPGPGRVSTFFRRLLLLVGMLCGFAAAAILLASAAHADPDLPVDGNAVGNIVGAATALSPVGPTPVLTDVTQAAEPVTSAAATVAEPATEQLAPVTGAASPLLNDVAPVTDPLTGSLAGPLTTLALADSGQATAAAASPELTQAMASSAAVEGVAWAVPAGQGIPWQPSQSGLAPSGPTTVPSSSSAAAGGGLGGGAMWAVIDPWALVLLLTFGLIAAVRRRLAWWYPSAQASPG